MKKNLLVSVLFLSLVVLLLPNFAGAYITITGMINNIVTITLYLGGAIIIIFWVITGILFLVALGAPEKLGTAKKALIFSIAGTVICLLALGAEQMIRTVLTTGA